MKEKFLALLVVTLAAVALLSAGPAQAAGIASTLHNLSPSGTGLHATGTQQNTEICVWCHTPHGANTAFAGAPLWNKANDSTSYTMYAATQAGTPQAGAPGGSSLACLSCHDGVNAINSLVTDASGTYYPGGSNVAFGATPAGTAVLMPAGMYSVGTNLQGTHPISIPYTQGKASLVSPLTTFGTTSIGMLLRNGNIECGSCHDPHVGTGDATAKGTVAGPHFLLESNAGSALCLACHAK